MSVQCSEAGHLVFIFIVSSSFIYDGARVSEELKIETLLSAPPKFNTSSIIILLKRNPHVINSKIHAVFVLVFCLQSEKNGDAVMMRTCDTVEVQESSRQMAESSK
jgi:hypothetical protein